MMTEQKAKGMESKSTKSAGKLCTNVCPVADLWINCAELYDKWNGGWLCKVREVLTILSNTNRSTIFTEGLTLHLVQSIL